MRSPASQLSELGQRLTAAMHARSNTFLRQTTAAIELRKLAQAQAAGSEAYAMTARIGGTLEAQADSYRAAFVAASAELGIGPTQYGRDA